MTEDEQTGGRRCGWCGVGLRWWQLNHCRTCGWYLRWDRPSPPCSPATRWYARPDRAPWSRA